METCSSKRFKRPKFRAAGALIVSFLLMTSFTLNILSTYSSASTASGYWTQIAPLPKPYYSIYGAVALNGNVYFLGYGMAERYDPKTNLWTSITPIPTSNDWPTGGGMVTVCENKIYVIGLPHEPTHVYDPTTNTWANRSSIPDWLTGRKANTVNNKIYVIGGATFSQGIIFTSGTNYLYDPTKDSWMTMAPIPVPVEGYASAVLDDKIYLIGGGTETSSPIDASNLVQIFDPKTNIWSNGTSIPIGVSGAGACATSGLLASKGIYVVGGTTTVSGGWLSMDYEDYYKTNLNQVYDPETGNWSKAAPIPDKRLSLSLVNVNDLLYAIGGQNGTEDIEVTERSNKTQVMELFASTKAQSTWQYNPIGHSLPKEQESDGNVSDSDVSSESFPWLPISVVSVVIAVVVVVSGAVFLKKSRR